MYPDGATEPMDCDTPHSSYLNPDVSQVFRSGDNAKRLKSLSKFSKIGGDMVDSKEYGRDKEQYDSKHKQLYAFGSEDSFPALDRKLEKDMAFVLQNLKDAKVGKHLLLYSTVTFYFRKMGLTKLIKCCDTGFRFQMVEKCHLMGPVHLHTEK